MRRGYLPFLLLLSALWGASYLFIKLGVLEMEPAFMMTLRLWLAAAVLLAVLVVSVGWRVAAASLRAAGRHGVVLGLINAVIPFWLIAWGETHIDSGIAAIANSTVPIFVTLLAIRFRPSERARGQQMVGIVIGLVGVGVLVGVHPEGGWWAIAGTLAVVLSSVFYASSNLYTQTHLTGTSPVVTATAALTTAAIVILPFGLLQVPVRDALRQGARRDGGARDLRHRDRLPRSLPDDRGLRRLSDVLRDVPDAGLRAPLRRDLPRRGDPGDGRPRAPPHPRRRRARLGRREARPALAGSRLALTRRGRGAQSRSTRVTARST